METKMNLCLWGRLLAFSVYLGGYDNEVKAARAYDLAALKYWGLHAPTNFPVDNYYQEIEIMQTVTKQEFIASIKRKSSGFSRGTSMYRGVTKHHRQGHWQARIGRVAGNKDLYLGTFVTQEEAAEAYDVAAIKFRGFNAVTNFEFSRYDVDAIASTDLPIGKSFKRRRERFQMFKVKTEAQAISAMHPTSVHQDIGLHAPTDLLQLQTTVVHPVALAYCGLDETGSELCSQSLNLSVNSQLENQITDQPVSERVMFLQSHIEAS